MALPALGSHSVIQRKKKKEKKEGDKKIKNRVLRNEGRRERQSRGVRWRGLRGFGYAHSVCPHLVQPVLELKDRTVGTKYTHTHTHFFSFFLHCSVCEGHQISVVRDQRM